jgi:valyl-tRNA synthetase
VEKIAFVETSLAKLPGARHTAQFDVHVIYEQKIDVAAECARLKKDLGKIDKEISSARQQLQNDGFIANAPADIVESRRKRLAELEVLHVKTKGKLQELNC